VTDGRQPWRHHGRLKSKLKVGLCYLFTTTTDSEESVMSCECESFSQSLFNININRTSLVSLHCLNLAILTFVSFVASVLFFLILKQPALLQLPSFTPNLTTVTLYTNKKFVTIVKQHVCISNTVTQYLIKYVTNARNTIAKQKRNVI